MIHGLINRAAHGLLSSAGCAQLTRAPKGLGEVLVTANKAICWRTTTQMQHYGSLPTGQQAWAAAPTHSAASAAAQHRRLVSARAALATCASGSGSSGCQRQLSTHSSSPPRLRSLRLQPAPRLRPGRTQQQFAPPPLFAVAPSWPHQPDGQQAGGQDQQHREYSTQPAWWQFWARPGRSGAGLDVSEQDPRTPPAPLPHDAPSAAHARELKAVNTAVVVNSLIFVAKMVTWGITGSGALLAEGMHSLADVANQILLKQGVIRSRRKPTRQHQYGFLKEKYIYALISAACVFCVGCGASILHGVTALLNPHSLENMALSLAVLLGSGVLEAYSMRVAFQSIQRSAEEHGLGLWEYIRRGRDPTTVAVLLEDGGAVAGLGLAGAFTLATYFTGQPYWDALGSISVGLLMGAIALQLMRTNKRFLLGQAIEPSIERTIVDHLRNDRMVVDVLDVKSEEMGDGVFRFKAEIQWNGEHIVQKYLSTLRRDSLYKQIRSAACDLDVDRQTMEDAIDLAMMDFGRGILYTVGQQVDRLESELKMLVPGLVYVDLESDRGIDRRIVAGSMDVQSSGDWDTGLLARDGVSFGDLQQLKAASDHAAAVHSSSQNGSSPQGSESSNNSSGSSHGGGPPAA